jgi:hypothetical protein
MLGAAFRSFPLPRISRRAAVAVVAVALALLFSSPKDGPLAESTVVKAPAAKAPAAKAPATKMAPAKAPPPPIEKRTPVTLRGEIVDYYCYIEKGRRGPDHLECALKCVSGDICMGLLTTDEQLFMISRNHMRAMSPLEFRGIPDPFNTCVGMIAESVDLSGYAMERKGQKIIEILAVKKAVPGSPIPKAPRG